MESVSQHHAYVYYGDGAVAEEMRNRLAATGVVYIYAHEKWGIDESRVLALEAHRTDEVGRVRHFILVMSAVTTEAQNALLKLFEEPPARVVFHCVIPPGTVLLPTLRSRLLSGESVVAGGGEDDALLVYQTLIQLPLSEQLAEVEVRAKKKDAVWIDAIRRGGLRALATQVADLGQGGESAEHLFQTLLLLGSRGAANKMLLEEVVLTVASLSKQR